ncbi:MAG: putative hemolysin [Myxococcota bacterium]|jgi:putative hemolysin
MKEEGKRNRFLTLWATERNAALTLILIGNNVVNITASALATVAFESWFYGSSYTGFAVPVAVFVVSFLILTFGEIIPKTFAQNDPIRFMPFVSAMYPFWLVLRPFTIAFTRLTEWFINLGGGSVQMVHAQVTEEDIEDHIERAAKQGNLDEEQKKLLASVFQFDDIRVQEVMKPRTEVTGIRQNATLQEILGIVEDSGYSRYPVFGADLDDIQGVLYVRDLLTLFAQPQGAALDLQQFIREPRVVPETKNIAELLREMQESRIHMAIVVDEHGGTAGVVTVEDIIEEVFGEIYDEYDDDDDDEGEDLVMEISAGRWILEGRLSCRDLEDTVDIEFPEEGEYSTVAGFILSETGDIPDEGREVRLGEYRFTVTEADNTRVLRLRMDLDPVEPNAELLSEAS